MKAVSKTRPYALSALLLLVLPVIANEDGVPCPTGKCAAGQEEGDEDQTSGTGTADGMNGGVSSPTDLGKARQETATDLRYAKPQLNYNTVEISENSFSLSALQIDDPQSSEVIRDNRQLRQVVTDTAFTDIRKIDDVSDSSINNPAVVEQGFVIRMYQLDGSITLTKSGKFYNIPNTGAFRTDVYRNPDFNASTPNATPSKLTIHSKKDLTNGSITNDFYVYERTATSGSQNSYRFSYYHGASAAADEWLRIESEMTPVSNGEPGEHTGFITRSERSAVDGSLKVVDRSWKQVAYYQANQPAVLDFREGLQTAGDEDSWLRRTGQTFNSNQGSGFFLGKPLSRTVVTRNAGGATSPPHTTTWQYSQNISQGWRQTIITSPWLDQANGKQRIIREALHGTATSYSRTEINGTAVASSYTNRVMESGILVETENVAVGTGKSLETVTRQYANEQIMPAHLRGRVLSRSHPDGTLETWTYALSGNILTITHDRGAPNGGGNAVVSGTRSIITRELNTYRNITTTRAALEGGTAHVLEMKAVVETDNIGRPLKWEYNGNANDFESVERECCYISASRSRSGVSMSYGHDPLKRQISVTDSVSGVTTTTIYDGLVTIVKKSYPNGSPVTVSTTTRNLIGEVVSVVRPVPVEDSGNAGQHVLVDAQTSYSRDYPTLTVTTTLPNGGTEIRSSYRDGSLKQVTGTAATPVSYVRSVHSLYDTVGILTVATALDDSGTATSESVSTWADSLGRTIRTEIPDDASDADSDPQVTLRSYAKGRLDQVTDPDGLITRYEYDARGQQFATVLDMTRDDGDANERRQESLTLFDPSWPAGVGAWKTTQSLNGITLSTSWRSNDGMQSKTQLPGVTAASVTNAGSYVGNADGAWTVTTTEPEGTKNVATYQNHRLTRVEDKRADGYVNVATAYGYHPDWGYQNSTSGRGGATTVILDPGSGRTLSVTAPGSRVTSYFHDKMGQVLHTAMPESKHQYATYTLGGQLERRWGDLTYPVENSYDHRDRLTGLTTFRNHNGAATTFPSGGGETTHWSYYPATGLLATKTYPIDPANSYTYTPGARLKTRSDGRGVSTTYTYDFEESGEPRSPDLHSITYSDSITPAAAYDHFANGLLKSVDNGLSATIYDYDAHLRLTSEQVTLDPDGSGNLPALTRTIGRDRDDFGRPDLLEVRAGGNVEHGLGYVYGASGRMRDINATNFPSVGTSNYDFRTHYHANSAGQVWRVETPGGNTYNAVDWALGSLSSKGNFNSSGGQVSKYVYSVNDIGQRDDVTTSGSAFVTGDGLTAWGYNARGEVSSANHPTNASDRFYAYDSIGNRKESRAGSPSNSDGVLTSYTPTDDNQYLTISGGLSASPGYDDAGNMTSGPLPADPGANSLSWDGENRLIGADIAGNSDEVVNAFDANGRRVAVMATLNGTDSTMLTFYDGWNPVADYTYDENTSAYVLSRSYVWGLDLSGSMQGAGGVGGLLGVKIHVGTDAGTYYPTYDGNGNVSEYLDTSGLTAAHYEYDPFGNDITPAASKGSLHESFDIRFSTKRRDEVTGLYYYGYRYYDPVTGRWPSRDPIGERGGLGLYSFNFNAPISLVDVLGRDPLPSERMVVYRATPFGIVDEVTGEPEFLGYTYEYSRCEDKYHGRPYSKPPNCWDCICDVKICRNYRKLVTTTKRYDLFFTKIGERDRWIRDVLNALSGLGGVNDALGDAQSASDAATRANSASNLAGVVPGPYGQVASSLAGEVGNHLGSNAMDNLITANRRQNKVIGDSTVVHDIETYGDPITRDYTSSIYEEWKECDYTTRRIVDNKQCSQSKLIPQPAPR